jgi:hypothetical protein
MCLIGGILMLIGTISGLQIFRLLIGLYFEYGRPYVSLAVGEGLATILSIILTIIFFIIIGGGLSVILGTLLVIIHAHKIGKIIISLGSGMGIFGLFIFIGYYLTFNPIRTGADFGFFILTLLLDVYFIGIILTIIGRKKMKKIKEDEIDKDFPSIEVIEYDENLEETSEQIKCPVCAAENLTRAVYCGSCGFEFTNALEHII